MVLPVLRCVAVCLLAAQPISAVHAGASAYTFTLDGKPFAPTIYSVYGFPGAPQPGDVIEVNDLPLVLGPAGACRFSKAWFAGGLMVRIGDAQERVAAVHVGTKEERDESLPLDPLSRLSEEEVRGLMGIRIDDLDLAAPEKLKLLDPARVCVQVALPKRTWPYDMGSEETALVRAKESAFWRLFPPHLCYLRMPNAHHDQLPPDLGDLRFLDCANSVRFDIERLRTCRALRYLDLSHSEVGAMAAVESLTALRELRLAGCGSVYVPALKGLEKLHFLDLSWTNASELASLAELPRLVRLDISHTGVADLRPICRLTSLAWVNAERAPVETLPRDHMPSLRMLKVVCAKLSDRAVERFARAHPQCEVWGGWQRPLRTVLRGITRLRVRSGGLCHRNAEEEQTVLEQTAPDAISELVASIRIDEHLSRGGECACCGGPTFEFYRGGELAAAISVQHWLSLRWPEHWQGDARLTRESIRLLRDWGRRQGIACPTWEDFRRDEYRYMSLVESPDRLAALVLAVLCFLAAAVLYVVGWRRLRRRTA